MDSRQISSRQAIPGQKQVKKIIREGMPKYTEGPLNKCHAENSMCRFCQTKEERFDALKGTSYTETKMHW